MEGKKKLKIITPNEISSLSVKNITSAMTFKKLKKSTGLLTNCNLILLYNNLEINLNEEDLKIEDIFKDYNEIVLEIKIDEEKGYGNRALKCDSDLDIPSVCNFHSLENCHYFCENCSISLCFRCCLNTTHKQHSIKYKIGHFREKFTQIQNRFDKLGEIYRNIIIEGEEVKNKTINIIENQFELLNLRINEMKVKTINFFEEYFENFENETVRLNYEYERIENLTRSVEEDFSLKNLNFKKNIEKIDIIGKNLDLFNKHIKVIEEYFSCKQNLVSNFQANIDKISVYIDKINANQIPYNLIKYYDEITFQAKESKFVINQMNEIINNPSKITKIISMPIPQTKKVLVYNFEKKQYEISLVPGNKFKFYDYCRFLNFDNFLLFNGGIDKDNDQNSSFLFNIKETKLLKMTEMIFPRAQQTLFYLPKNLIFAIGGYNNQTTEIYDMRINIWHEFKELNTIRSNSNILVFNDYLFVFGGSDGEKYLTENAERIKISSLNDDESLQNYQKSNFNNFEEKFFQIKFRLVDNISANFQFSGSAVIYLRDGDINKTIVFGGFNAENNGFITDIIKIGSYIPDEANLEFTTYSKSLGFKSCFYNQNFFKIDNNFLAQFDASGNVIFFDKTFLEFSQIKNSIIL